MNFNKAYFIWMILVQCALTGLIVIFLLERAWKEIFILLAFGSVGDGLVWAGWLSMKKSGKLDKEKKQGILV